MSMIASLVLAVTMTPIGEWRVSVSTDGVTESFSIDPPTRVEVKDERHPRLPPPVSIAGWRKECKFLETKACECTVSHAVVPDSFVVKTEPDGRTLVNGRDYMVDLLWGTIEWKPGSTVSTNVPISVSYVYRKRRIDSIVRDADGRLSLRKGEAHVVTPVQPALAPGETRIGNVFLDAQTDSLRPRNLFPVLEPPPKPVSSATPVAARLLPKTWAKLNQGGSLTVLAWGDSVTSCGFLPNEDKWQEQFIRRLRRRFPKADIRLVSNGWGGRCSNTFLKMPENDPHNFTNKVAGVKADLVISEFVNDCGHGEKIVREDYPHFLQSFREVGSEWIAMTPHYVRLSWMGLKDCHGTDNDPRPFVHALRKFAAENDIALADASRRWGHLWREGIPFSTMYVNDINHPVAAGMTFFADALMEVFGGD
ncbi:MAG: hypothetical protein IKR48_12060 [Kiritimatiellae bacterium]|nr:hypothetical protein [Kiritimatiellia bacterium]